MIDSYDLKKRKMRPYCRRCVVSTPVGRHFDVLKVPTGCLRLKFHIYCYSFQSNSFTEDISEGSFTLFYTPLSKSVGGYTGLHLSVRPSVLP